MESNTCILALKSGGNNFNDFTENQSNKFRNVRNELVQKISCLAKRMEGGGRSSP